MLAFASIPFFLLFRLVAVNSNQLNQSHTKLSLMEINTTKSSFGSWSYDMYKNIEARIRPFKFRRCVIVCVNDLSMGTLDPCVCHASSYTKTISNGYVCRIKHMQKWDQNQPSTSFAFVCGEFRHILLLSYDTQCFSHRMI